MTGYFDKGFGNWLPSEPTQLGECTECGVELYEGEEVVTCDGEVFCDIFCLSDYLVDTVDWSFTTLEKGDGYDQ